MNPLTKSLLESTGAAPLNTWIDGPDGFKYYVKKLDGDSFEGGNMWYDIDLKKDGMEGGISSDDGWVQDAWLRDANDDVTELNDDVFPKILRHFLNLANDPQATDDFINGVGGWVRDGMVLRQVVLPRVAPLPQLVNPTRSN